jgi:hypothetical protein
MLMCACRESLAAAGWWWVSLLFRLLLACWTSPDKAYDNQRGCESPT